MHTIQLTDRELEILQVALSAAIHDSLGTFNANVLHEVVALEKKIDLLDPNYNYTCNQ